MSVGKTQIVLDLDGVLVDFIQGALDIHNIKTPIDEIYAGHSGDWDIVKLLGMPAPAFWKPMNEEFWAKLDWMSDGREILAILEERYGQENICIWTSPCDNYGCYDGKKRWVREHLPKHYRRNLVVGPTKYRGARPDTILVDDGDHNVEPFREWGGHACLVPRHWNKLHGRVAISSILDQLDKIDNDVNTVSKIAA